MMTSHALSAPVNDLRFLQSIQNYAAFNADVAKANKAFERHLWHLTEDLGSLTFFSQDFDEEKEEQRITLINHKYLLPSEASKRQGSGFGL